LVALKQVKAGFIFLSAQFKNRTFLLRVVKMVDPEMGTDFSDILKNGRS
jgi:hypothetical protein